jgi:LDH2 family malate/lactate/ureidoglycolate dehydrogenase
MTRIALPIETVRATLTAICQIRGLSAEETALIVSEYLDAELCGVRSHGALKMLALPQAIRARQGKPRLVLDRGFAVSVDGQRELGILAAHFCTTLAIERAAEHGLGMVALRNAARYGRIVPFGERIAQSGMIGIIMNVGGTFAAPPNTNARALGVNPMCIALPRAHGAPIVGDFATAEGVWSEVLLAQLEGRDLPPQRFIAADGAYTTQPEQAHAVRIFGGAKGFLLNLTIEALCSALIGALPAYKAQSEYDLGFLFLAFSSALFRSEPEGMIEELEALATMLSNLPSAADEPPRLPNERSATRRAEALKRGTLDLHPALWSRLQRLAADPNAL